MTPGVAYQITADGRGRGHSTSEHLARVIRERAQEHPGHSALVTVRRSWTFGQLAALVTSVEQRLEQLPPSQPVAIVMGADGESVAALLAAQAAGHPSLLVPAAMGDTELADILTAVGVSQLVAPEAPRWAERVDGRVETRTEGIEHICLPFRAGSPVFPPGAGICQRTSGSMNMPKLAVRGTSGILSEIRAVSNRFQFVQDRVLCASSIAHSYGLIGGLLAPLMSGAEVLLASDGKEARALVESETPTIIVGLAATYQTLLGSSGASWAHRVRVALSAGAPLPFPLWNAVAERFGLSIRQDYGTTETGTIAIDMPGDVEPRSVGKPLPHLEVRIVPPLDTPLKPGEVGEIQVRGSAVARGYLERVSLRPSTDREGWFHTGDIGSIDGEGRLLVGRRLRPLIAIGDRGVAPEDVERAISAIPGVREVAVIQVENEGRTAMKAIVVAPDLTAVWVRDTCRSVLPVELQPGVIELREALPRSPAGKTLYASMV